MEPMTTDQREKALFDIISWALEELAEMDRESAEGDIHCLPQETVVISQ